jgi:hypothetical protein
VYPFLGFAEVFQDVGMNPQQLGTVIVSQDKSFSFEEYVWSLVRCHFEPDETVPSVEVGWVGEETARGAAREDDDGKRNKPTRE